MTVIITIYERGESAFAQRLRQENNCEAVMFINALALRYLQNTIVSVSDTERVTSPTLRTSPLGSYKES